MGGFDDHAAIMGDWMPPSPSPRTFFSSLLGDDIGSRSTFEFPNENKRGNLASEPQEHVGNSDGAQTDAMTVKSDQKMSSRGGLLERMAARAGFNAPKLNTESLRPADLSQNQGVRSPYLTIPPGLSPTSLLESPVFLSNSLVQPSPTTGKFQFASGIESRNSTFMMEDPDKRKENALESINSSSFSFKPVPETASSLFPGATSRSWLQVNSSNISQQCFPNIKVSVHSQNSLLSHCMEATQMQNQNEKGLNQSSDFPRFSAEKDVRDSNVTPDSTNFQTVGSNVEHSPPLDEPQDEEIDQRVGGDPNVVGAPAEDGYNWRKYGQKQVKGSEYPRSYYKCTHPNCPVKKKVERSHEGHITEIIYKGAHNHPKPPPNRRSALGSTNSLGELQLDGAEQGVSGSNGDLGRANIQKAPDAGGLDWRNNNLDVTSSAHLGSAYCNGSASFPVQNNTQLESGGAVDVSSTFSNDEDEDDRGTHGSVSQGYDGEGDESESKRRKLETYSTDMSGATRAIREPRVVVQTTSEVDILDDGYRWRKYGQKVVKGNPNPRSYYKCTSAGCNVRKHVERASHDLKSVITTYEGKHNHDVPAARNSSHVNSGTSNTLPAPVTAPPAQSHLHRPEPAQLQNAMARFDRQPSLGSFGPSPGFSYGMNQQSLASLAMAGFHPNQSKSQQQVPVHSYLGQPRPMHDGGFMFPKEEPKAEPMSDPGLDLSNGSSIYQQFMSRLPLGPQM
ncbi:putative WRKY transcription factor 2 isoform X2 [Nicotiana tabacum]|uniref:WRKY transcription factor 2 isoform X2 n=5 Tax=Nicotiana TaxID=4085 RepID=A0AC58S2C5_TOBAC|nr:PREDICTED: probable WRKY transcription factor 2 isoform X3 [Nicotiana sylvestris]XP_009769739.1 PREDICTED: probable WRKY transcription factor 2 isoform X3 [Nicotiana sylvestris]XP_016498821.1 PREDICTED: probable WRKY transcription factor 2 isoform X3 [Nicotiana tabacum]XP_016498822.1 PREDICTED: probable WRKY transcription factor 2 isoform X3 [Nicotiana tabacum]